jgi:hypothetical protein
MFNISLLGVVQHVRNIPLVMSTINILLGVCQLEFVMLFLNFGELVAAVDLHVAALEVLLVDLVHMHGSVCRVQFTLVVHTRLNLVRAVVEEWVASVVISVDQLILLVLD